MAKKEQVMSDWRRVLRKARSVKWALASGLLSAIELGLSLAQSAWHDGALASIPKGTFAACSMLAAIGIPVARVYLQQNMKDDHEQT